jgi:hypothetical protein
MRELPKAIPLLSPDGKQVGFMLLAVEPSGDNVYAGECVFVFMPENASVIESDLGVVISELKIAGEHPCRVSAHGKRLEFVVMPHALPQLRLVRDPDGESAIVTLMEGAERQVGIVGE